jgi:carbon-monoxide dehydrogenase medium subunit
MPDFELHRPTSIGEALEAVAAGGTPYCGGTELVAVMKMGMAAPESLVDLKRVPELVGIEHRDTRLVMKARTTHAEAAVSPLVRRHATVLANAVAALGNARVRATGTIGGNICFAEPRSDVLTALMALDASVQLRSPDGVRTMGVAEFVEGAFTTVREEHELLEAVQVPLHRHRGVYLRFQPAEYPTLTVAIAQAGDAGRVVVGAVAEKPAVFSFSDTAQVDVDAISAEIEVVEDLNGSEDYKRHLVTVLVRRALAQFEEAGHGQ